MEFSGINKPNNPDDFSLPPFPMPDFENDEWSQEEYSIFVTAMIRYDIKSQGFIENVFKMLPLKSMEQVKKQFDCMVQFLEMTEDLSLMPTDVDNEGLNKQECFQGAKIAKGSNSNEGKKQKTVHWTEEEHRLFLMGLNKYQKGHWKRISTEFVTTKTPIQVATHAQKFYKRQSSTVPIDKRRRSIHDIQLINPQFTPQNHNANNIYQNQCPSEYNYPMLSSMNAPSVSQGSYHDYDHEINDMQSLQYCPK